MIKFSDKLRALLSSRKTITLQELIDNFEEKSFAILFLLFLAIPALPLPTGGVTHIFEIIAILLALEMILGRKTIWLPNRWLKRPLPKSLQTSALPKFIKIIKWVEKFTKPRLSSIQRNKIFYRLIGFLILVFSAFAFLAPPFTGLDTLPALGVVFLSLSLIFEDILIAIIGIILGSVGIGLVLFLGKAIFKLF